MVQLYTLLGACGLSIVPALADVLTQDALATVAQDFNAVFEKIGKETDLSSFTEMLAYDARVCMCGECGEGEDGFNTLLDGPIFSKVNEMSTHMGALTQVGGIYQHRNILYMGNDDTGITLIANSFGKVNEVGKISEYYLACSMSDMNSHKKAFILTPEEIEAEQEQPKKYSGTLEKGVKKVYQQLLNTATEGNWKGMAELFAPQGVVNFGPKSATGNDQITENLPKYMRQLGFHPLPKSTNFKNFRVLPNHSFDFEFVSVWIVAETEVCKAVVEGTVLVEMEDAEKIKKYTMVYSEVRAKKAIELCQKEDRALKAARELDVEMDGGEAEEEPENLKQEL
ncbi:hypothetical protein SARC_07244 [Sphaeroforma arctica JP610]|uniref:SnoaL-like domain-containing protein n=1 Tax=Sphaeroforma arctica JP610 TaxID=667725 RepID=A0A0L0FV11_9EUKA|nr:hypothetical protein SARC_07244 [Sphaeroforma arctica JP610]KNC80401.1 hypothetical protein SARC_07244 [Sphaeroforma arctica JP610]|eukprot:XP_014154303.1 hypothetical protein SARC_07244 [Sphaeroforma arctica JP610]